MGEYESVRAGDTRSPVGVSLGMRWAPVYGGHKRSRMVAFLCNIASQGDGRACNDTFVPLAVTRSSERLCHKCPCISPNDRFLYCSS